MFSTAIALLGGLLIFLVLAATIALLIDHRRRLMAASAAGEAVNFGEGVTAQTGSAIELEDSVDVVEHADIEGQQQQY